LRQQYAVYIRKRRKWHRYYRNCLFWGAFIVTLALLIIYCR
jgi:hypothetical protein